MAMHYLFLDFDKVYGDAMHMRTHRLPWSGWRCFGTTVVKDFGHGHFEVICLLRIPETIHIMFVTQFSGIKFHKDGNRNELPWVSLPLLPLHSFDWSWLCFTTRYGSAFGKESRLTIRISTTSV